MTPVVSPARMRVAQAIHDLTVRLGKPPLLREIADHLGLNHITVHEHVHSLIKLGVLTHEPKKHRTVCIVNDPGIDRGSATQPTRVGTVAG